MDATTWNRQLKIALVEENEEAIDTLVGQLPDFDNVEQMERARELITQAKTMILQRKEAIAAQMREMETARKFLTSSKGQTASHLDITS